MTLSQQNATLTATLSTLRRSLARNTLFRILAVPASYQP
jgi:hypothetical protein